MVSRANSLILAFALLASKPCISRGALSEPVVSVASGSYAVQFEATVSHDDPAATIRYTTSGIDPTPMDAEIKAGQSILIDRSGTLKLRAFKGGESPSAVLAANYLVTGSVTCGDDFSLTLDTMGKVRGWGYNSYGQLGDGSGTTRANPVAMSGLSEVIAIAAGMYHSYALRKDGTVWASGYNGQGQLGDGTNVSRATPVQVLGLSDVVAIAAGSYFGLAAKRDGTVWAWGDNAHGELGDGTTTKRWVPVQIPGLNNVRGVAAGEYHSMALREDGGVWSWGYNGQGQLGNGTTATSYNPIQTTGLTGVTQIAAGKYFSLALRQDGIVRSWGSNECYALGDGTGASKSSPVVVSGLSGVISIDAGPYHGLAVKEDGTLWTWGYNYYGNLGDGTATYRSIPVAANIHDVRIAAAGYYHTVAVTSDGTVKTVGLNFQAQLGNGNFGGSTTAFAQVSGISLVPAGLVTAPLLPSALAGDAKAQVSWVGSIGTSSYTVKRAAVSGGPYTTIQSNISSPSFLDTGLPNGDPVYYVISANNASGPSADSVETVVIPLPPPSSPAVLSAIAGAGHVYLAWSEVSGAERYVIKRKHGSTNSFANFATVLNGRSFTDTDVENGTSYSYIIVAANTPLSEGPASNEASTTPREGIARTSIPEISPTGWKHPVQVTVQVTCGDSGARMYFTTDDSEPTEEDFEIRSGENLLIDRGGTLKVRAFRAGAFPSETHAATYTLNGAIAAGRNHSVALQTDGTVKTWGINGDGQLGVGTTVALSVPTVVAGINDVLEVDAGANSTFAVRRDGTVWGWGANGYGQLGDGTLISKRIPTRVLGIDRVAAVAGGTYHTVALREDGTVWTWGSSGQGQLGDGTLNQVRQFPVQTIGLTNVVEIAAGHTHSLALKSDGTVWAWGLNTYGQLGDGTTVARSTPVQVVGLSGVKQVAATELSSFALMADQTLRSWGRNGDHDLGDGTSVSRLLPVPVGSLSGVTSLGAGGYQVVATKSDGSVRGWGNNNFGQVGDGTQTQRSTPSPVLCPPGAVSATGGQTHSTVLLEDGTVWSVGNGDYGKLGNSSSSTTSTFVQATNLKLLPDPVPSRPLDVSAEAGAGKVEVGWTGSMAATSYTLKRAQTPGGPYSVLQIGIRSLSFVDEGAVNEQTNYYIVTASNASGESPASLEVSAKPEAPPAAPAALVVTAAADRSFLSWDTVAGATSYTILRSTASDGEYETVGSHVTGTSFIDTGLEAGAAYYYKVASANTALSYGQAGSAVAHASAVGSTAGSFDVDESGSATYSIPIAVPSGTGGMEPKLAMSYSSGGGNGPLGLGWSLGGLSVITRGGTSMAQDGFIDGVDFDDNDRFYLDGERLVAIEGVYGADETEYRTENTNFSKIVSHGSFNGGPVWFEIWTKSGLRLEFGRSENAEINNTEFTQLIAWGVNKIEDTSGNSMWIHYDKEVWESSGEIRGEYNPSHIYYTYNPAAGLTEAANCVRFLYETRPDVSEAYIRGTLVKTRKRLKAVQSLHGSSILREYRLTYELTPLTGHSRIVAVQEFGAGGEALPATVFDWSQTASGWTSTPAWTPPVPLADASGDADRHWIDINGDGLIDVVWHRVKPGGVIDKGAWLNTGSGFQDAPDYVPPVPLNHFNWTDYGVHLADLNGDGLVDLLVGIYGGTLRAWLNTGTGWQLSPQFAPPVSMAYPDWPDFGVRVLDVNGDGRADLIHRRSATSYGAYLNTGSGWQSAPQWAPPVVLSSLGEVWEDLNSDGLPDLLYYKGSLQGAYLNTGSGWVSTPAYKIPVALASASISDFGRRLADVNGDGLPDLLYGRIDGAQASRGAYINTGRGWAEDARWTPPVYFAYGTLAGAGRDLLDVNGDGALDLVYNASGNAAGTYGAYLNNAGDPGEVVGITDGLGASVAIDYRLATDPDIDPASGRRLYTKGSGAIYPVVDGLGGGWLVAQAGSDNGLDGRNWTHYAYGARRGDQLGRGDLGFGWIETVDGDTGTRSTVTYRQDFPFEGLVETAESRLPSGTILASTTSQWASKIYDGIGNSKYYFPYLTQSTITQRDLNGALLSTATTSGNTYDDFGNLLHTVIDSGGGYRKITDSTYTNDAANWKLGRLQTSQVVHEAPGTPSITRRSGFGYKAGSGLLDQETVEPGSPEAASTAYGYDAFGNIVTTTVTGSDIAPRGSVTTYDPAGRFALSVQNAVGHVSSTVPHPLFGSPVSTTDINGHTTSFLYDGFGRPVRQENPDGTVATTAVHWADDGAPEGTVYGVTTQTAGLPAATVWYDRLGRAFSQESVGDGGRAVYAETLFDAKGRAYAASDRYFDGDTPLWTLTEFDLLDRPVRSSGPKTGDVTETIYNGLTVSVKNAKNQLTTSVSNSIGQTVSVTDAKGGTIAYTYDAVGNLLTTTAPGNAVTAFTYDSLGRKKTLSDPDSGFWQYFYYSNGELKRQTDAKNQETSFTYDKLGRTLTKTEPEGVTTYTYDTQVHGLGLPATVTHGPSGITDTFSYDSLSRPSGSTRAFASGQSYAFDTDYDGYSRPVTTTYPSGFSTTNHYDALGFLRSVSGDTGTATPTYWQAQEIDAEGRITKEWLGNGLVTTNTYERATGFLKAIQTKASGLSPVQDDTYDFDLLGNLEKRTDLRAGKSESFGYDELNRLTTSQVQSQALQSYTYAANGNILSKTGVGTYAYGQGGAGPHAVTSVTGARPATYAYDANGNQTSGGGRTLQYVSHNKPSQISDGATGTTLAFTSGPSEERVLQVASDLQKSSVTRYLGGLYEVVENYDSQFGYLSGTPVKTEERHYIGGPGGTIGVYTESTPATGPPAATTRYLLTDHLGSTEAIADELGNVVERFSYDAFGAKRDAATWAALPAGATPAPSVVTPRGFTGHEMLDAVGLVHMGGRIYDPILGRVLSADPIVQAPGFTQSYNRYSYCINNPLSLTDPSGYSWLSNAFKKIKNVHKKIHRHVKKQVKKAAKWVKKNWKTVVVIVAVVVVSVVTYGALAPAAATIGTTAGAATQAFGAAVAAGAAGGAVQGGLSTALYGGKASDIFANALKGAAIGAATAAVTFGIGHGIPWGDIASNVYAQGAGRALLHGGAQGGLSAAQGGDFWSAALAGAAGSLVGSSNLLGTMGGPSGILVRTSIAAAVGGTAALIGGGDFANGAVTAAFVHLFNHEVRWGQLRAWRYAGKHGALEELKAVWYGPSNSQATGYHNCAAGIQDICGPIGGEMPLTRFWQPGMPATSMHLLRDTGYAIATFKDGTYPNYPVDSKNYVGNHVGMYLSQDQRFVYMLNQHVGRPMHVSVLRKDLSPTKMVDGREMIETRSAHAYQMVLTK